MTTERPTNEAIAEALEALANALDERGANPHRVQAYLTAAQTVRHADQSLADLVEEAGPHALEQYPGIGDRLALRIAGFVRTGRLQLLEQIRQEFDPAVLFTRVAGIGAGLAQRIHEKLGVETLEELELAAHDGRLEQVEGFGRRRVRAIRNQLNSMLNRETRRRIRRLRRDRIGSGPARLRQPDVEALLNVDLEYRYRSKKGELEKIAPQRFNPTGEAWLPVLHTRRGDWTITALFSNTARAHELGKIDDWVVLYGEHRDGAEQQFTVVTETRGELAGQRVVRGREAECRTFYQRSAAQTA